jgi:hypothetical protein
VTRTQYAKAAQRAADTSSGDADQASSRAIADPNERYQWLIAIAIDPSLPASAARLCTLLAFQFFDRKKMRAYPSQAKLAAMLGMQEDSVHRLIARISRADYVRKWKGYATSNNYVLTLPIPDEMQELNAASIPDVRPELGRSLDEQKSAPIPDEDPGQSRIKSRTNHGSYSSRGAPMERPPGIEIVDKHERARDDEQKSGALDERHIDGPSTNPDHASPPTEKEESPPSAAWPPDPEDEDMPEVDPPDVFEDDDDPLDAYDEYGN